MIAPGYCGCGCGRKTRVPTCNNRWKGDVVGVPKPFVRGHQRRYLVSSGPEYEERDMGYETPCWVWIRSLTSNGYGRAWCPNRKGHDMAHRVVYERAVGQIPEGHDLHHLCRTTACVNPEHLTPMTRRQHMAEERRCAYGNPSAPVAA